MNETIEVKGEIEAEEETITVEELDGCDRFDNCVLYCLESWCGIMDTKFVYIKKEGNHLIVGKATIKCVE